MLNRVAQSWRGASAHIRSLASKNSRHRRNLSLQVWQIQVLPPPLGSLSLTTI